MVSVTVWIYHRNKNWRGGYRQYRFFVMNVYKSEIRVKGNKRVKLNRLILRTRLSRIDPRITHSNPDEVKKIYIQDKIFKRIVEQD